MKLQLMALRKRAGYKNRDDFAKALGVSPAKYKSWETGTRRLPLADACDIADFLHCSLDELAGRWEYVGKYADERQKRLNSEYQSLDEPSKDAAVAAISGMAAASKQGQGGGEEGTEAAPGARRAG